MCRNTFLALSMAIGSVIAVGCQSDSMSSPRADSSTPSMQREHEGTNGFRNTASDRDANDSLSRMDTKDGQPMPERIRNGSNGDRYTTEKDTQSNSGMTQMNDRTGNARTAGDVSSSSRKITAADKMFIVDASGSNQAEIAAAEIALQKSSNPQVKQFAQQMITDHRMAQDKLTSLARSKDVDLETNPPQAARSASWELGKLSGAEFDQQYWAVNHAAHMKTVAIFQHAANYADDSDIKSFAQSLLPTLQQHTQQAGSAIGHSSNMNMNGMNR